MAIRILYLLLIVSFIFSCTKDKKNDNLDIDFNNTSRTYENPFIEYNLNGAEEKIIAYADSVNQRISIGYGSGSIIGTDTCFVHYSCSFLRIIDTNSCEIKIEFFKTELKPSLKEYYGAFYYPSIIELGNNLLYSGYRNILYQNDDKYYPGVKVTYIDSLGNYFYSTDTLQSDSYFIVKSSEKSRDIYYDTCQKIKGSFNLKLRNSAGDSLINFSGSYFAIFKNPL